MSSSKPPRTRTGAADDPGLPTLLALPPGERRDAVAKDIRRRAPQFSAIPAHDLADALDVPEHWRPGSEWSFTRYAPIVSVEEHARHNSPASELVYLIEEAVSAERFQQLLKHSEPLDESDDPSFAFLTKGERSRLEDAIAEKQMEANESTGMNCIARCSVESASFLLIFYRHSPLQPEGKNSAWCMSPFFIVRFTVRLEPIPSIDVDRSRQTFSIRDNHLESNFDRSR